MSSDADSLRRRQQNYRASRAAKGEAQMQVWLDEELRRKLDDAVRSGAFKNRSELIAVAVNRLIEGTAMQG